MKTFWTLLAVTIALLGVARRPERKHAKAATTARPASQRMNVLLITIDTLRADHLGTYGYRRKTSPHIDALAAQGTVFEQAYTYLPKTRGSFVMIMTGRRPSQNGYSKKNPGVVGCNTTLAGALKEAGYVTAAVVDNLNVAAQHGYDNGFDRYRETWKEIEPFEKEMERSRLITEDAVRFLENPPADRPFFLWLHYVNPHAPYTPPPPFDTKFLDEESNAGPVLGAVKGYRGGVREEREVRGKRLGYYGAQYDGEIAAVDQEVGTVLDALGRSPAGTNTMVVLTSDHGESLGEHDYYFDHGEDVHDPCLRIPLVMKIPGVPPGARSRALASTVDLLPTILNATKVALPPDLAGRSLLAEAAGQDSASDRTLFAENEHHHVATFDSRLKTLAIPDDAQGWRYSLYDRSVDPGETRDLSRSASDSLRVGRRELELAFDRWEQEWRVTRRRCEGAPPPSKMSPEDCERLRNMGYTGVPGCENY